MSFGEELDPVLTQEGMAQYKLLFPRKMYTDLQQAARLEQVPVVDIVRRAVGLYINLLQERHRGHDVTLIIQVPGEPDRIVYLY